MDSEVEDYSGMPNLADVTDTEDSDDSDTDGEDSPPPAAPAPSTVPRSTTTQGSCPKPKITSYWRVETPEEKAVRMERDAREFAARAEEVRLREIDANRMKAARKRADATERMQRFRERGREEKIANGWIPGQKRVSRYAAVSPYFTDAGASEACRARRVR
ncbi:hypothetical protein FB451DRAFT_299473 [Mycena latifolia]|nr:hypothetical protein FB451DRAFT_299473 [Mycena latifolia]